MTAIQLTGSRVHYRRDGNGPTLVLLHANPGDSRDFDAVFAELATQHDVIAPDWPGFGGSSPYADPAQSSPMAFYETLVEFLDALAIDRCSLVGNSVGGYAAARLAIEQPLRVERLVLVSPGGFTPHNALTRAFCRWQASSLAIPPGLFARLYLRRSTPAANAMRARAGGEQSAPGMQARIRAVWRSFLDADHDLRQRARAIRCPVQLVFGRFDPVIAFWLDGRAARRAIPHAALHVLPTGHAPFAEAPPAFMAVAKPFLAQVSG